MAKLKCGILGATGTVGRTYVSLLKNHPWFEVSHVAASPSSAGKPYGEAVEERWHLKEEIPAKTGSLALHTADQIKEAADGCDFVFSALDSGTAKEWEERYAKAGIPVVSNASTHRRDRDVPMIIPEVNPEHADVIPAQQKNRGWSKGFIAVKPNCSIQSYMAPLHALRDFGVKAVIATTMQAVSGAGHSDFRSIDIEDNVIPFIRGEEEKSENEPLKIMGKISGSEIIPLEGISISAHCNRVPVIDGHMACVSVRFETKPSREQVLEAWQNFRGAPQELRLPTAPEKPIIYREEPDRPQTRYDRDSGRGMAVTCGRLRDCKVTDYRFVGLSNNIIRGAAGGGMLNAELLKAKGYLK